MNVVEATFGDLIDRTLLQVQAPVERGASVVLGVSLDTTTTSFTLSSTTTTLSPTDIVEFAGELMLVSSKTDAASPEYTVSRGYFQTTAQAHSLGAVGQVNPQYTRKRVGEAIRRSFARLEALGLPLVKTKILSPYESVGIDPNRMVLSMPEDTRTVLSVRTTALYELPRWEFLDNLPTGDYGTGKVVRLPGKGLTDEHEFYVVYQVPYRWSQHPTAPVETDTILLPEGAEDLPCSYATAFLLSSREVSRTEIDRAEEWARNEPLRGGGSSAGVNRAWQEFYRALDEARRLSPPPRRRPYFRRA